MSRSAKVVRPLTRRQALKRIAATAATVALGGALAGCVDPAQTAYSSTSTVPQAPQPYQSYASWAYSSQV